MRLVVRSFKNHLFTGETASLRVFALVTDGFAVKDPAQLALAHFPAVRLVVDDGKNRLDIFSNAAFCHIADQTLFVIVEDAHVPFSAALASLPARDWSRMHRRSTAAAAARVAADTATFGSLNLARIVRDVDWRQISDIAASKAIEQGDK